MLLLLKQFPDKNRSKPSACSKLSHFSEMRNDALMHREGLKGQINMLNIPHFTSPLHSPAGY